MDQTLGAGAHHAGKKDRREGKKVMTLASGGVDRHRRRCLAPTGINPAARWALVANHNSFPVAIAKSSYTLQLPIVHFPSKPNRPRSRLLRWNYGEARPGCI